MFLVRLPQQNKPDLNLDNIRKNFGDQKALELLLPFSEIIPKVVDTDRADATNKEKVFEDAKKGIDLINEVAEYADKFKPYINDSIKLGKNIETAYSITNKDVINLKFIDINTPSKYGKSKLSELISSIEIGVYTGQESIGPGYSFISNTSDPKKQFPDDDEMQIPNIRPFNRITDWQKYQDHISYCKISIVYKGSENVFDYYCILYRPMYIDFVGISAYYQLNINNVLEGKIDTATYLDTSNVSISGWLAKISIESGDKAIWGIKKIALQLPIVYTILQNDEKNTQSGFGIGLGINFNDKISLGFGYDMRNSTKDTPIFQILIGTDLGAAIKNTTK